MDIVVTDHHQADRASCPTVRSSIRWSAAIRFRNSAERRWPAKLASRDRREAGARPAGDEADLDLVALATVADVMPLVGENRHLVREGVKVAQAGPTGRACARCMAETRIEPSRLNSEDFGFRLGPRINAAGRMYRADAGVELFLSESKERAEEIAGELAAANVERRRVEQEVETAAEGGPEEPGEPGPAVVVAGEGWHPGVVGIVASKLVKSTGRPAVVIAIDGDICPGLGPIGSGPRPPRGDRRVGRTCSRLSVVTPRPPGSASLRSGSMSSGPRLASRSRSRSAASRLSASSPSTRWSAAPISVLTWPKSSTGFSPSVRPTRPSRCWFPEPESKTSGRWGRASTAGSPSVPDHTGRRRSASAVPVSVSKRASGWTWSPNSASTTGTARSNPSSGSRRSRRWKTPVNSKTARKRNGGTGSSLPWTVRSGRPASADAAADRPGVRLPTACPGSRSAS